MVLYIILTNDDDDDVKSNILYMNRFCIISLFVYSIFSCVIIILFMCYPLIPFNSCDCWLSQMLVDYLLAYCLFKD